MLTAIVATYLAMMLGVGVWCSRTQITGMTDFLLAGRRLGVVMGAGALLACLYAVSDFGAVSILRYDTLATAIYSQYRFSFDRSSAAVLALLLTAVALALVMASPAFQRY